MKMRHIPELHFNHDDSIEKGAAMDALIEEAVAGKKPVGGDQQD